MKKVCTICQEEKILEDFVLDKRSKKDGRTAACKKCFNQKIAEYYKKNPDKKLDSDRASYEKSKEKKSAQKKEYYLKNKEKILLKTKEYAANNKEKKIEYFREYYLKNKKEILLKTKEHKSNNKKQTSEKGKIYYENNLEYIKKRSAKYQKNNAKILLARRTKLINSSPLRQFKERIRLLTRGAFYRLKKHKKFRTNVILGADCEIIKEYFVSQFKDGMTWEAFVEGKIHVDHIQPLASATTEEELIALCHYKNLQPLWALDNLKKGSNFNGINYKTKQ